MLAGYVGGWSEYKPEDVFEVGEWQSKYRTPSLRGGSAKFSWLKAHPSVGSTWSARSRRGVDGNIYNAGVHC